MTKVDQDVRFPGRLCEEHARERTWKDGIPMVWSFVALETALRDCWDEETCDPAVPWDPDNPAAGHCGVTSMALTELLGGVLLWADVTLRDGTPNGIHYWNRLDNGLEIDLTRDQFRNDEKLGHPSIEKPLRLPTARMATRYDLYAARVRDRLGCHVPRGIPTLTPKAEH